MQIYGGPERRVIRKQVSDSELRVDGIVNCLEERGVYCKQEFKLTQTLNELFIADHHVSTEWLLDDEKGDFERDFGTIVPFAADHVISDRFILNKTVNNLVFKPDQAFNYLTIENQAQLNLAPYLCSEKQFNNVTRAPEVSKNNVQPVSSIAYVQHSAYGRMWFGFLTDVANAGAETGLAPYVLPDATAVWTDQAGVSTWIGVWSKPVRSQNTIWARFASNSQTQ